jgi:hypothetical protein
VGLPPELPEGAAALYRFVSQATPDANGVAAPSSGQAEGVAAWLAAALTTSVEPV